MEALQVEKKKNIYDLTQEILSIYDAILDNDGELTPGLEQQLQINEADFEKKAIGYGFVILDNDNQIDALAKEIKRLQAIKKTRESLDKKLKERILGAMNLLGRDKVEAKNMRISIRKSEGVIISDENAVPNEFKVYEPKILVAEIKKALKEGVAVAGAELEQRQNIQIK